jgi:thiamine-phosphate pyrophosphorylase
MMNKPAIDYRLYLVTDQGVLRDQSLVEKIETAIQGGVTIVQLREKQLDSRAFYDLALDVKQITDRYDVPLIINDRLDIALAVNAAGLHVGQNDLPANVARKLLGEDKILGVSSATLDEAVQAEQDGADYVGFGSFYPTLTKNDTRGVTIDQLHKINEKINIPIVAIGGINEKNARTLIASGANGIAVVSAILGKSNSKDAAKNLIRIFY